MDNKEKLISAQKIDYKIQNKERGQILYYSIDQVADLLNENVDSIKYNTNIFDNILKIEIVDKELRYTNSDVDKLEFLMKLKNKGMSIKEIENYYNKLPLNNTEEQPSESNLLSVEELIISIKEAQQTQLENFKIELITDMQKTNLLYLKNISSALIEAQDKSLNDFKQNLTKEIADYLDSKFNDVNEFNINSHNKLLDDTIGFMSEKFETKNSELKLNLQNDFDTFAKSSLKNNESLIKEVKDYKRVITDAYYSYYSQSEIEMNTKSNFFNKLFQIFNTK